MGACLVQLVPHSFTDVGDKAKLLKFIKESAAKIEDEFGVATICGFIEDLPNYYAYGRIRFNEDCLNGIDTPRINLRKDFWQIDYIYHYGHIVSNVGGELYLRDFCCRLARALGSSYSHYTDDYYIQRFESIGDSFDDIMRDSQRITKRYSPEYFKEHEWREITGHYSDHYDDYFEDLPE